MKKLISLTGLLLLVFPVQCIFAQDYVEIEGQVLSAESKQGVPLANVQLMGTGMGTSTSEFGYFSLSIPDEGGHLLVSSVGFTDTTIVISPGASFVRIYLSPGLETLQEVRVLSTYDQSAMMTSLTHREVALIPDLGGGVETLLKTLPGVSSNNELSNQYNVRGGSFDENMIYVNHIEVYRPLLIRSGKQEGLSFVNSDMISSIRFSAGGFDASYGDKMASVLDIRYAVPDTFSGSFSGSLLGARGHLMGRSASRRFTYNIGARYKTTGQLLNTTETKGDYEPRFFDVQSFFTYQLTNKWQLQFLGNYNKNLYAFAPTTRSTSFGTLSNALNLQVYYEGEEKDEFETGMGALSLVFKEENKWQLQFITSYFATAELENYDILGEYSLNELDKTTDSQTFTDSLMNLGVGAFLNHARNQLYARVGALSMRGGRFWRNAELRWGATYKYEHIEDEIREWNYLDSAGYSLPRNDEQLILYDARSGNNNLRAHKLSGYVLGVLERSTGWGRLFLNGGLRLHYRNLANNTLISPRVSASFVPAYNSNLRFQAAVGLYFQPPFYKEMRRPDGGLNTDVDAQKSTHYLLGAQWQFSAWERPFQLHVEAFYKDYDKLIPYKQDNVQLQYAARNQSEGYAVGLDVKINGEFVPGVESWASLSILNTREDIVGDSYTNPQGETEAIGSFPRPTDQLVNFSLYFQDYVPGNPTYRMYLSLHYGSRLPFASPEADRYDSVFRMPSYRRVDLGLTKAFDLPEAFFVKQMELSAEVFNLIDIDNTISYLWVKTVDNQLAQSGYYAVPNYLTGRMLNIRFRVNF